MYRSSARNAVFLAAALTLATPSHARAQDFQKSLLPPDSAMGAVQRKVVMPIWLSSFGSVKFEAKVDGRDAPVWLDLGSMRKNCMRPGSAGAKEDSVEIEVAGVRGAELVEPGPVLSSGPLVLGMDFLRRFKSIRIDFSSASITFSQDSLPSVELDSVLAKIPFWVGEGISSLGAIVMGKPWNRQEVGSVAREPGSIYAVPYRSNRLWKPFTNNSDRRFLFSDETEVVVGGNTVWGPDRNLYWVYTGFEYFRMKGLAVLFDNLENSISIIRPKTKEPGR